MGWLGDAAAASLMMDLSSCEPPELVPTPQQVGDAHAGTYHTSCFWPDTRAAGLSLPLPLMVSL